jgi:hypothetical protein
MPERIDSFPKVRGVDRLLEENQIRPCRRKVFASGFAKIDGSDSNERLRPLDASKQNTVPLADRTVPEAGQYGPSGRTVVLKKAAYGT